MTNKEQREIWEKEFERIFQPSGTGNREEYLVRNIAKDTWLAACEYMHENMSQSRYNFWKLTRIQQKKIDVLIDSIVKALNPPEQFEDDEDYFMTTAVRKLNQALQKIEELDESEGK